MLFCYIFVATEKSETTLGNPMIIVPATQVRLGKPLDYPSHGWDNDYGQVDCKYIINYQQNFFFFF